MASERQRLANIRNGRLGGPKTEASKQNSRRNSLKHGLTSSTLVVLPEEHQDEYEEVLRGLREAFQPVGAAEDALVLRLAQDHWRSLRSRKVETAILSIGAGAERAAAKRTVPNCPEHLDVHNAIAVGFMIGPAQQWPMYLRYDTAISRDFFRTLEALTRLQRARQQNKPPQKPLAARAAGAQTGVSENGIRSVSQQRGSAESGAPRAQAQPRNRLEQRRRRLAAIVRTLPRTAPRPGGTETTPPNRPLPIDPATQVSIAA